MYNEHIGRVVGAGAEWRVAVKLLCKSNRGKISGVKKKKIGGPIDR